MFQAILDCTGACRKTPAAAVWINSAGPPHESGDTQRAHTIIDVVSSPRSPGPFRSHEAFWPSFGAQRSQLTDDSQIQDAEKTAEELRMKVTEVVKVDNWTESLAEAVLARLDDAIKRGIAMKGPLKEAFDKAVAAGKGFARDHPVWTTLIALGILVILLPCVLEALGFGELGPVAGRFAAWWMRRYAGYVPKGSLYAFLQRLDMVWRRSVGVKIVP